MRTQRLFRRLHYWGAAAAGIPIIVIICSGVLLQLKKQLSWVQPTEVRGSKGAPTVSFDQLLALAQAVPDAGVRTWDDIVRIEGRPQKGLIKLVSANDHEIQIDLVTGAVLHSAHRRSDLIESIHDGSFFHDNAKLWLFLPAALVLLGLWCTGLYLFLLPFLSRRRRRARLRARMASDG
jgi:uncharacterized iron-regulated membrane protein